MPFFNFEERFQLSQERQNVAGSINSPDPQLFPVSLARMLADIANIRRPFCPLDDGYICVCHEQNWRIGYPVTPEGNASFPIDQARQVSPISKAHSGELGQSSEVQIPWAPDAHVRSLCA